MARSTTTMGFELTLAAQRDPWIRAAGEFAKSTSCAMLELNGTLDASALDAIDQQAMQLHADGVRSIVIEMHDVSSDDASLAALAANLMSLRATGVAVQIDAMRRRFHALLAALPDARDWLLTYRDEHATTPRQALHLDGGRHQT